MWLQVRLCALRLRQSLIPPPSQRSSQSLPQPHRSWAGHRVASLAYCACCNQSQLKSSYLFRHTVCDGHILTLQELLVTFPMSYGAFYVCTVAEDFTSSMDCSKVVAAPCMICNYRIVHTFSKFCVCSQV